MDIDLRAIGGSALTADLAVPKGRSPAEMGEGIPVTYVPARNTIFLSFALAWAEVLGASDLYIGVNALDYSGYPDCRAEYIAAFEAMASLATKALDHHTLNDLPGLADADPGTLTRWIRDQVPLSLPVLDRVDLHTTPGCGAMLAWGEQGPALPT